MSKPRSSMEPSQAMPGPTEQKAQGSDDPRAFDAELVARCQLGDSGAFDELVLSYQDRIFRLVYRKIGGRYEEAQEVTQEVFIRAYRALASFRGGSSFYTWLFRIAINTTLTARGKVARREKHKAYSLQDSAYDEDARPMEAVSKDVEPAEGAIQKERMARIEGAISTLPSDHRDIILLREVEGLKYEEIGEILDLPVGSVKSRLHRARGALRDKLHHLVGD